MARSYAELGAINHLGAAQLPSKAAVAAITEDLLHLLFPGFYDGDHLEGRELGPAITELLGSLEKALEKQGRSVSVVSCHTVKPLDRPGELVGHTYKVRWPDLDHAFYITINDIDDAGRRRPFEIFINAKNMEHYAWTVALTRMIKIGRAHV